MRGRAVLTHTGGRLALGAALGVTLLAGGGVPAAAATLLEALTAAYQSNPTLLAQRAALRATDEEVPQALSGWRPTVTVDADAGVQDIDTESSAGLGAEDTLMPRTYSFSIVQPLFQGGRTVAGIRRAERLVEADRARLAETEQDVFLDVVTVYMNVLREKAVLDLAVNNEQRLRRRLQSTRDRFEVGEVTRTDVAQAESRLSVATADRVRAEGDLTAARAAYLNVVGVLPEALRWPEAMPGLPASDLEGRRIAVAEHPALKRALAQERAARADIEIAFGVLLPDLNLRGAYQRSEETSTFVDSTDTATLTAELTVPLYQSGAEHSRVRQARQVASQRRIEVEQTRRAVLETVTQRWQELETARARTSAFRDAVKAAEIALEGVSQEATVGTRTVLDVLDAENELFQAKSDLVRARRDAIVASFGLAAAIGRLDAQAVGLSAGLYDPEANYRAVRDRLFGTDAQTVE